MPSPMLIDVLLWPATNASCSLSVGLEILMPPYWQCVKEMFTAGNKLVDIALVSYVPDDAGRAVKHSVQGQK